MSTRRGRGSSAAGGGQKRAGRAGLDARAPVRSAAWRAWLPLVVGLAALPALGRFVYLVPDSAGHLAWAHSLFWDRDLEFDDDYARFGALDRDGSIAFAERTPTGRRGNPFGMGSALLAAPWIGLSALIARIVPGTATDGFGTLVLLAAHLGSWTCALGAFGLVSASLVSAPRRAVLAGAFLGTPLPYYVLQQPSYAHAASAFTVALVIYLALRWRQAWKFHRAALLGGAIGLAALVRVQEILFVFLPPLVAASVGGLRGRASVRLLLVYVGALLLVLAPQFGAWMAIYGGLHVPQGQGFLQLAPGHFPAVLFASRHGLLAWSPVVALALAGIVLLVRARATRWLGVALGLAFALQWLVNALPVDWWAGWSFGARRFVDCVPLVALGLAAAARLGRVASAAIYVLVAASLVQWARVATGGLSGEADPGWNGLWGAGFWSALPALPSALGRYLASPWTSFQVLRQPQSTPPDLHADPLSSLWLLYLMWAAAVLGTVAVWKRRRAGRGPHGTRSGAAP